MTQPGFNPTIAQSQGGHPTTELAPLQVRHSSAALRNKHAALLLLLDAGRINLAQNRSRGKLGREAKLNKVHPRI